MKSFELGKSIICHKMYDPEIDTELHSFLAWDDIHELLDSAWEDIVLVLWGDGTMLTAIQEHYGKNIPFLWINFWSIWFLLNDKYCADRHHFTSREYPLLEVQNNWNKLWVAFNEINVYATSWNLLSFEATLNESSSVRFKWDGLLISTPAGSTWHSASYGAPLLEHSSNDLIITPKWSNPKLAPNIINWSSHIRLKNTGRIYDLWINLDWQIVYKTDLWEKIDLSVKKSEHIVHLLIANEYLETWDRKVMQQQGFIETP